MTCPGVLYWGGEDRQQAKELRRARERLEEINLLTQDPVGGIDFVEFADLDHGAFTDETLTDVVIPTVTEWFARRVGRAW